MSVKKKSILTYHLLHFFCNAATATESETTIDDNESFSKWTSKGRRQAKHLGRSKQQTAQKIAASDSVQHTSNEE